MKCEVLWKYSNWLVVSTPLKNISQLGWLFPVYAKINVPNHQPVYIYIHTIINGHESKSACITFCSQRNSWYSWIFNIFIYCDMAVQLIGIWSAGETPPICSKLPCNPAASWRPVCQWRAWHPPIAAGDPYDLAFSGHLPSGKHTTNYGKIHHF